MAGQTAEDIRDNIVKITDENRKCVGTGFFIHKDYCVTCHHNIWQLDEIFVERELNDIQTGQPQTIGPFHAEWVKEFSDMQKDIAFLKVKRAHFKPLQYERATLGKLPVAVRGFPFKDLNRHPDGKDERGTLSDVVERLPWEEEEVQGTKEWNVKPKVNVQVFNFKGNFDLGFSGAPVCYEHGWQVVGMFEAKDATKGYVIPMYLVVEKFDLGKGTEKISAPLPSLSTEEILNSGNKFYNQHDYEKAIEQYDIILKDRNYLSALVNKGLALFDLGRSKEAIEYYDRVLAIEPNDTDALNDKGLALDNLGRHEEAIEYYDRVLAIEPNDARAWYYRACTNVKLGNVEEGLAELKKAIEIDKKYYVKLAKKDKDFDSIRNDKRFRALIKK